jgi:hypothetical protein
MMESLTFIHLLVVVSFVPLLVEVRFPVVTASADIS